MKTKLLLFAMFLFGFNVANAQIPCNANFTYTIDPSGLVTFTGVTGTTSTTYNWIFGNGTTGYGLQTTCMYNTPGNFTVCLYVEDSSSVVPCIDSNCVTITIGTTSPCMASFTDSATSAPYTYDFTSTSTGMAPFTYLWYWSDGSPYSTSSNPGHTFPGPGTYTVCLSITSASGCTDSTCQVITVGGSSSGCTAGFYVYEDTSLLATPHTYIGVNTTVGTGVNYLWTWGDGTSSTGPYPSHSYATAGNYNICLVITSPSCVDSFCLSQIINKHERAIHQINFQAPTSVQNVSSKAATIYPNPAEDKLFIAGVTSTNYQVEIYNMNGSKVMTSSAFGNQSVNISNLPANLYMVKISELNGKSQFAKFMKE